jgi:subtilisin family serine protease
MARAWVSGIALGVIVSSCVGVDVSSPRVLQESARVRVNAVIPCLGSSTTPSALLEGSPFSVADYFGEATSLGLGSSERDVPWCLLVLETRRLNPQAALVVAEDWLTRGVYARPYGLSLETATYATDPSGQSFDTSCAQRQALDREAASAQPILLGDLRSKLGFSDPSVQGRGVTVAVLDGGVGSDTGVSNWSRRFIEPDHPSANPRARDVRDDFDCVETPGFDGHGDSVVRILRAVAPQVEVIALKVCDSDGVCSASSIAKALLYLRNRYRGIPVVDVVNMSFGGRPAHENGVFSAILQNMMVQDTQALFVTSMGNTPNAAAHYPADYQGMHFSLVPVAAAKHPSNDGVAWALASFNTLTALNGSAYEPLAAPAVRLVLNDARVVTGTSFAAPIVSGVAALERQRDPVRTSVASHLHWHLQMSALEVNGFKLVRASP